MIAIIDYGMGNVGSVENALLHLGAEVVVTNSQNEIERSSHIILPGVGAFAEGMRKLRELGLPEVLEREVLIKKKPFLGICLGMQLLAEEGEEGGTAKGLGWIRGMTRKLIVDEARLRLPHIGWDDVAAKPEAALFQGVLSRVFYFVHSYALDSPEKKWVAATCEYGEEFCAAVERENIFGVQFHPEKSQKSGLALLRNFLTLTSPC